MTWTITITILLALLVTALAMNFARPEKKLGRKALHRHALTDPQFKREMSALLGPAVLSGNHIVDYQNGDDIFPSMLEAQSWRPIKPITPDAGLSVSLQGI